MTEQINSNSFKGQFSTGDLVQKYKADMMKLYKNSQNYKAPEIDKANVTHPPGVEPAMPESPAKPENPLEIEIPKTTERKSHMINMFKSNILDDITCLDDDYCGYLQIEVTTGNCSIPIENAHITVLKDIGYEKVVLRFMRSNRSGKSPTISLPAPSRELSQAQGNGRPYSTYNILVSADGFYSAEKLHVPVFSAVRSIQPVDLVPLAEFEENARRVMSNYITDTKL